MSAIAARMRGDRLDGLLEATNQGLFGVVPAVVTVAVLVELLGHGAQLFATDFHAAYWPAARDVLRGLSPYPSAHGLDIRRDVPFVYPAVAAILFAPFGLLPRFAADLLFAALNMLAVPAAMRLLGVRDWRAYGFVLVWLPVVSGWQRANVSLLLLGGVALVWHYRDRPAAAGVVTALLISAKPVLWPLGVWLLATRRHRAVAWALASGALMNVAAWSLIGFGQLTRYEALMSAFAQKGVRLSVTTASLLVHLGVSDAAASVLGVAPGIVAAIACLVAGRRGDDRMAMVLCVAAVLLATSVAWLHYFALLIVPLALTWPRLNAVWALPLALWVCLPVDHPSTWQIALTLLVAAAMIAACLPPPRFLRLPVLTPATGPSG